MKADAQVSHRHADPRVTAKTEPGERTLIVPGVSRGGQPILSVLLKRTYRIVAGAPAVRASADRPIIVGDVYYGEPVTSSLAFESDMVAFKNATDVVLNGKAHAPDGQPTEVLYAALTVAGHGKEVMVIGDRLCHYEGDSDPRFEDPTPFTEIDLQYEHAYGGVDWAFDPSGRYPYPRNPVGRGFVVERCEASIEGLWLPNIEDPDDPLTPGRLVAGEYMNWEEQPQPQGFGWFGRHWEPRGSLGGTMPETVLADGEPITDEASEQVGNEDPCETAGGDAAQLPALDFDFFSGASPGLVFPFLAGDEAIATRHLAPEGELNFFLPGETLRIGLDVGEGLWEPPVVLQTVMIRMEDREIDMVWRAASAYPGLLWLDHIRRLTVLVA